MIDTQKVHLEIERLHRLKKDAETMIWATLSNLEKETGLLADLVILSRRPADDMVCPGELKEAKIHLRFE
jgi:hypothetical protein